MYNLDFHIRPNGSCPYDDYVKAVFRSGAKKEAARIRATVDRLKESGSARLATVQLAEKMNDVWQLRIGAHRLFYFWHVAAQRYVMLSGFRKRTPKTPPSELERAEAMRVEHLETGRGNESTERRS